MPSETDPLTGDEWTHAARDDEMPETEAWRKVNITSLVQGRHSRAWSRQPVITGAVLGALAIAILPVVGIIWKAIICDYGLDLDLSGAWVCLPVFMGLGAAVGALAGLIGRATDIIAGYLLAVLAGGFLSVFVFLLFMIPDC